MKFKVYQRITAAYWKEIANCEISSVKELKKFYDKYGHLDEPLKVYFDEYNGNYIIIE